MQSASGIQGCVCIFATSLMNMFTGIIEFVGTLTHIERTGAGAELAVDIGPLSEDCHIGDSICSNGICLTVTTLTGNIATYAASPETLVRTCMGGWRVSTDINCERALAVGSRLGGHIVSGHVDGIGRLQRRQPQNQHEVFTFQLPSDKSVKVVEKGSVAIDGISLTTFDCRGNCFSIAVIPHTLGETTLGRLQAGQPVNMEQDPIGRWVESLLPHQR